MSDKISLSCTNSLITIMIVINHRNIPWGPRWFQPEPGPLCLLGFISSLPQLAWDKRLCCCCTIQWHLILLVNLLTLKYMYFTLLWPFCPQHKPYHPSSLILLVLASDVSSSSGTDAGDPSCPPDAVHGGPMQPLPWRPRSGRCWPGLWLVNRSLPASRNDADNLKKGWPVLACKLDIGWTMMS